MKLPELLAPAGNFEKLRAALLYGADAVYIGGKLFGMRSAADNFTDEELREAVEYTHARGKKLYVTVNTMPRGNEYPALCRYLELLGEIKPDALIVADLGVIAEAKRLIPHIPIHISTQASIVSPAAARAYAELGATRLVLARELNLDEIVEIRRALPEEVELEAFIHGSMCVSYSGRCMLSNHLVGRDANRGGCAQPCRWNYTLYEEKRPDIPIPIEENELGTFVMSSKDMCTIGHIPELIESGIASFKIEGRMKSAYYTAVVTNAYRMAMDAYAADPAGYRFDERLDIELDSVSHREYCTGYYFDASTENAQLCSNTGYMREKSYFATAVESELPEGLERENSDGVLYPFIQRNKLCLGDVAEVISPSKFGRPFTVTELYSEKGEAIESTPHPSMVFWVRVPFEIKVGDIMRAGGARGDN